MIEAADESDDPFSGLNEDEEEIESNEVVVDDDD